MIKTVLVTGGAGYIGSHTVVELLNANYNVIIADNLVNSDIKVLSRIEQITNRQAKFYNVDICNKSQLELIFNENSIDSVIHFAALKAVGESNQIPLEYYINNISGSLILFDLMQKYGVRNLVFSSSATVYGDSKIMPLQEDFPTKATNPYGRTKLMIEEILTDLRSANNNWNIIILRYFNPVGAHVSGLIGENPNGIPNNLMPYISQVAVGKLNALNIFGNDYQTHDGTGVRDYIHVVDLALGHVSALSHLANNKNELLKINLGTGIGYSVLDVINTFQKVNNITIKYNFVPRRTGDVAICYADPKNAKQILAWQTKLTLEDMCRDSWNWQSNNPNGY